MVLVQFQMQEKTPCGFTVSGHSGSGISGTDIVCAALSSAVIMTLNTLTEVMELHAEIEVRDGFSSLSIQDADALEEAAPLLHGFLLHVEELAKEYPKNIRILYGDFPF